MKELVTTEGNRIFGIDGALIIVNHRGFSMSSVKSPPIDFYNIYFLHSLARASMLS